MISFIIIGCNEGWKLTKCIESVLKTINLNNLINYEIIYVDSKSTDDSIKRVKKYKSVKIFELVEDTNAAIGRNTGVKESKGDVLFLIDGDMEIIPSFLSLVYTEKDGLKYEFVSGQFIDYFYTVKWEFLSSKPYFKFNSTEQQSYGGLFLIKKHHWESAGGMKTHLRINEDIDFGLRLVKNGILLTRLEETLAIHHTIKYTHKNRIWKDFFNGNDLYPAVLLRENFFNKYQQRLFFRQNYTLYLLFIVLISAIISKPLIYFIIYFIITLLRCIKSNSEGICSVMNGFFYHIIRDVATFLAFLFFWPRKKKNIKISEISNY